jgi:hypothetical protein
MKIAIKSGRNIISSAVYIWNVYLPMTVVACVTVLLRIDALHSADILELIPGSAPE